MDTLHIINHPLVQHKLTLMRDKNTCVKNFRTLLKEISMLMGYEVTRDFELTPIEIETPICKTTGYEIAGKKIVIVPILRAGLGMTDGILELIPDARVGHIGMYRNEETHEPVFYYCKMPGNLAERGVLLTDPMLATGGSAVAAIAKLKEMGCKHIRLMCLVAAPEGVKRVQQEHPDVNIYVAAVDERMNENAYIVPGLGDAGDRIFGTK